MATTDLSRPIATTTINQQFFIEAQRGAQSPTSYLSIFPESVYTHAPDSLLVLMLYVLMGPMGAGFLREQYLYERLKFEAALLEDTDLDTLYTSPFGFARLAEETYEWDASASLLTADQRAQIQSMDADFRNRALNFLGAVRAGGTPLGIALAAQSGLDHPVDVIENYQALWDQYCDIPLGLEYFGKTTYSNEVIIRPTPDQPSSGQQTLTITGNPVSGWFTLSVPLAANYITIPVTILNASQITVPDSSQTPVGTYVSVTASPSATSTAASPIYFGQVSQILSPTSVALTPSPGFSSLNFPGGTFNNSYWAYVGVSQTAPIPYNATAAQVQASLLALPVIGPNDVQVTGGPFPDLSMTVSFTGNLANTRVPIMAFNINTDAITGILSSSGHPAPLTDITNVILVNSNGSVEVDTQGSDGSIVSISPTNEHNMQTAVDQIRPITTLITTIDGRHRSRRYQVNQIFSGFNYTEVIHYARGHKKTHWPKRDKTHWVESGKEHQGPRPAHRAQHHHHHNHDVASVMTYTEDALISTDYGNPNPTLQPLNIRFWNVHVGAYNPSHVALYPFLGQVTDSIMQMSPSYITAPIPNQLFLGSLQDGTPIVNDEYPVDYIGLPGIPALPTQKLFWSSIERITGTDYVEIDLGTTQAVNIVTFEATQKPYLISLSYDTLDQSPQRNFEPVTIAPLTQGPSTSSLSYDKAALNPWTHCQLLFTDTLGNIIFTRYLRLELAKASTNSPLATPTTAIPYSIEIRNLRVGRYG